METEAAAKSVSLDAGERQRNKKFASFIVFDSESTCLNRRNKRPKITELCMLSVQIDELKSDITPRVINKLQLCFNPESVIQPRASTMTGLFNDALEKMAVFKDQAELIIKFITSQPQPTCLIAHNGHGFDFPLLQAELSRASPSLPDGAEVWCADSLEAFRIIDGLTAKPEWLLHKEAKVTMKNVLPRGRQKSAKEEEPEASEETKVSRNLRDTSVKSPPNKRQAEPIDYSTVSKHGRGEPAIKSSYFSSQLGISNSEVVELADTASDGNVAAVVHDQQSEAENTPRKDCTTADQFVKRKQPPLVDHSEREKIARRLFDDQSGAAKDAEGERTQLCKAISDSAVSDNKSSISFQDTRESISADADVDKSSTSGSGTVGTNLIVVGEEWFSYKLSQVYKRQFGCVPDRSHTAEDDCVALFKLIVSKALKFIDFVETRAVHFDSVCAMY